MKTASNIKAIIYKLGSWLYLGCPASIIVINMINSYDLPEDVAKSRPIVNHLLQVFEEQSVHIMLLLCVFFLLGLLMKRLGDQWVLEKLQFILDEYQGKAFKTNGDAIPTDHNRVTLFKFKTKVIKVRHWTTTRKFGWSSGKHPLFSDYLIPILRSGHLSKKTRIAFHAPDSGDDAEGVAGRAWASQEAATVAGLPTIGRSSPQRDIKNYARSTYSDEAMIRKYISENKPMPCSIVAIPVERKGKKWGVVVLDSRYPNGLSKNAVDDYQLTVALIGHLLERL